MNSRHELEVNTSTDAASAFAVKNNMSGSEMSTMGTYTVWMTYGGQFKRCEREDRFRMLEESGVNIFRRGAHSKQSRRSKTEDSCLQKQYSHSVFQCNIPMKGPGHQALMCEMRHNSTGRFDSKTAESSSALGSNERLQLIERTHNGGNELRHRKSGTSWKKRLSHHVWHIMTITLSEWQSRHICHTPKQIWPPNSSNHSHEVPHSQLVSLAASNSSISRSEKMPPSSSLERQWSLKSIALRILKHLRFSVKVCFAILRSKFTIDEKMLGSWASSSLKLSLTSEYWISCMYLRNFLGLILKHKLFC